MKNKIALILILTLLLALCAVFAACVDPHEHDLQHFEAKDPTCVEDGNIEYWYCAGCGKYFADEAAGKEIAKEKTVLAATGEHDWSEWVAGEGENCETGGTLRRSCSICGKTEEQTFSAGSHKLEYVGEVPSTCIEAGNRAHWHCEMCGKNFADQNAEELLEDVSLPLGAHNIVDGKCAVCGLDKTFIDGTPGLQYTLNKEGTAYTASGIGTATETDIVIASEYNGLSVTSIGNDAFYDCDSLTSIVIPNSVTSIGNRAFGGCDSLTSITLPDSVTSIGGAAFFHCYSLKSITIPDNVTSIGSSAFLGCDSLTSITIPDSVTSIDINTFASCDSLTSITIPDSVTSIGDYAFSWCDSLTSITIGDSVTSIGDHAFLNCDSLTSIMIPDSVTSIDESAFSRCNSLASIVIPESVTNIGNGVFYGCSSLASIVVEEGNTVYHSDGNCIIETDSKTLVVGCKNSVIPSDGSVTRIGEDAFFHCYSLTSIVIPDSITSIGNFAFGYCSSLTSINIPDGVTSIGDNAFAYCRSLESIIFQGSMEQWRAIDKGTEWNLSTGSYTVICTDDVLDKNGNQI